jgi:enoyl-CoA hydratase/carnithine racemase
LHHCVGATHCAFWRALSSEFPTPVIALIEGGICEVVMVCDILVAILDAAFAKSPARLASPIILAACEMSLF